MTHWWCRECDSISRAVYETKRGVTSFVGWKCSACGFYEKALLGPLKIKEEKRLPR